MSDTSSLSSLPSKSSGKSYSTYSRSQGSITKKLRPVYAASGWSSAGWDGYQVDDGWYGAWLYENNNVPKTVRNVANVALADATEKQKPSAWTKNMLMLYYCLFIATLNSVINGYNGSLMTGINSYPQYRKYFGFDVTEGTPETGIVFAIYTIGNLVGSFFAGPASDMWGRKWGMFIGAAIIVCGTCVQAPSTDLAQFMGGRFLLGFGVAIVAAAGPAYVSEMAHPTYRGTLTGIYNTCWFAGGIPGTFIPYLTSELKGPAAWRIPLWLQIVFSGIVLLASPWLPETPRWLVANDKHEEAMRVMAKYHGEGKRDSPIVQLEYREMVEDISMTGADKRWWDYSELFNNAEVRYRTGIVVAMSVFGQWSGNGPVSYYYPQMLANAGFRKNDTQLLLNALQNVVSFGGALCGAFFTDRWGRRPQLLVSTAGCACMFILILALNSTNLDVDFKDPDKVVAKNPAQSKALIAIIFVFGFVYSAGYTPLQAMYPVECLRFESRAKGMGLNNLVVNIANFYNTFVTGIAFSRIQWRYYFLFVFWDLLEFAVIYFFFVETRNRTLEELTAIFRAKKPVKESLRRTQVVLQGEEGVTEMVEEQEKGGRRV